MIHGLLDQIQACVPCAEPEALSQLQSSSSESFRSDDDDEQPDVSFVFSGTNRFGMASGLLTCMYQI